jgi:hypothetical protein
LYCLIVTGCDQSVSDDHAAGQSPSETTETGGAPETPVEREPVLPEKFTSLSFPELDPYESGSYFPFLYVTYKSQYYLHFNIFGRGWNSKPQPDTFILQKDGTEGDFPIGKWMNIKSVDNEYVEFTSTHMTRYSSFPYLGTTVFTYTVENGAFHTKIISITYNQ